MRVSDWITIVSCAVTLAGLAWTAYEARKTRQLVKDQEETFQAQIKEALENSTDHQQLERKLKRVDQSVGRLYVLSSNAIQELRHYTGLPVEEEAA